MNISIFRTLLYAALLFPALMSAEDDCVCTVTGTNDNRILSAGCMMQENICEIRMESEGLIDMSDFEDLQNITVVVNPGTLPVFRLATLTDNQTRFDFRASLYTYWQMAKDNRESRLFVGILFVGVSYYNWLLSKCPSTCSILLPNISSAAPVTLMDWTTTVERDDVALSWLTADETDNSHFVVSRSTDGVNFTQLATVGGQGTTGEVSTYHYRDQSPVPGINYYRLEQVDFDGTLSKLGVQSVKIGESPVAGTTFSPNPVASGQLLTLHGSIGDDPEIALIDPNGRRVSGINLKGSSFRVPDLAAGVYTLRINGEATRLVVAR